MSVYSIRQYSLKNSGEPVVASYFVDSVCVCVSLGVDVHVVLFTGVRLSFLVFNTTYLKCMCAVYLYSNV